MALHYEALLRLVAALGDFREIDFAHPLTHPALQLACWLNAEKKARFYEPFGALAHRRREDEASAGKFAWFLPRFAQVLENSVAGRAAWQPEYECVQAAVAQLDGPGAGRRNYAESGWE